jgi:hypothetical protein
LVRAEAAGDDWLEAHGARLQQLTVIERELAQRRESAYQDAIVRAAHDPSPEVERELGPRPESFADQERWDRAAQALEGYRIRQEGIDELQEVHDLPPSQQPKPAGATKLQRDAQARAAASREWAEAALLRAQASLLRAEAAEKRTRDQTQRDQD